MFKVICIDASNGATSGLKPPFKEGEILTASQCPVFKHCYDIAEYPCAIDGHPASFQKSRFVPLSNKDERTIQKNRELDKIIDAYSYQDSI